MPMKYSSFDDYLAGQPQANWEAQSAGWNDYGGAGKSPYLGVGRDQLIQTALGGLTRQQWFDKNLAGQGREYNAANNQLGMMDNNNFELSPLTVAGLFAAPVAAWSAAGGLGGAPTGLEASGGVGTYGNPGMFTPEAGAGLTSEFGGTATGAAGAGVTGAGDASVAEQIGTPAGTTASPSGGGGTGGVGTSDAAKSILAKIAAGSATSDDWLKLLGQVGPSVLGAFGASSQSGALNSLADKFAGYGAPYRDQLGALMKDPSSFYSSPEATGAFDAMARKLSIGGNPAGDPYKQATLTGGLYSLLQGKENQLANFGGLSNYNAAAPGAATSAVGSNANIYNAVGAGLGNVLNPPTDLATLLKTLGISGNASGITEGVLR